MNARCHTRRDLLGALIGGAAILGISGFSGAKATPNSGDNYGSKAAFKKDCEAAGGAFVDSPKDKLTVCVYPDGDRKTCDQKGNNCVLVKKPTNYVPGGDLGPFGGFGGAVTTQVGESTETTTVDADPAGTAGALGTQSGRGRGRRGRGKRRRK